MGETIKNTIKNQPVLITVGTAISVIVFIVVATINMTTTLNSIQSNLKHLNGKTDLYNERWEDVLQKLSETQLEIVKLRKDVAQIQALIKR